MAGKDAHTFRKRRDLLGQIQPERRERRQARGATSTARESLASSRMPPRSDVAPAMRLRGIESTARAYLYNGITPRVVAFCSLVPYLLAVHPRRIVLRGWR